jgi:glycosyltransferase involved in cell wall biosynthesis
LHHIDSRTSEPHEIIVVNNASTDGTTEYLDGRKGPMFHTIHMPNNIGVIARNSGFRFASGNHIAQIDDDVEVLPNWDTRCMAVFRDDITVGLVGQQGGIIKTWMDIHSHVGHTYQGYVDYITGFCMMMKNVGILYDEAFGQFWHEELDLSLQFKYLGYRLKTLGDLCHHRSQRSDPVNWELHDRNLNYANQKWIDKIGELELEGMK